MHATMSQSSTGRATARSTFSGLGHVDVGVCVGIDDDVDVDDGVDISADADADASVILILQQSLASELQLSS